MTYNEVVTAIHARPKSGGKNGLANMKALMKQLGNPEETLKFVHIVGTNGKGSATAMTASVLQEAGYKVGRNISPYIIDFRERFVINGEMIPEETLAEIGEVVLAATEEVERAGQGTPIEFEVVTAIALFWFAKEKCDIVCMEAGIGGRLDSTNIIQNTLVTYVMHMGLDHQNILGETLADITKEKAGVFKNNCTVISYPSQPEEAMQVIKQQAQKQNCPLVIPEEEDIRIEKVSLTETKMNYGGYEIALPFAGVHQAKNAAVVIEGCLALWRKGFDITDEHIIDGIQNTVFPARIEVLSTSPLVIVDGAHNEDGVKALTNLFALTKLTGLTAVVGMVNDKDAQTFLQTLKPYVENIIFTTPTIYKALPASALAEKVTGKFYNQRVEEDVNKAIEKALASSNGILVTGSLYLAAEARAILLNKLHEK